MRVSDYSSFSTKGLTRTTTGKLLGVGLTVGPIVDSLHNQCLLRYDYARINIPFPDEFVRNSGSSMVVTSSTAEAAAAAAEGVDGSSWLLATSWAVPPLLAIAYIVLGGALPRLFQWIIDKAFLGKITYTDTNNNSSGASIRPKRDPQDLRVRAIVAVLTTAAIIKLSEYLETHPAVTDGFVPINDYANQHILVLLLLALIQWAVLDGTIAALLTASLASVGGPLSELPFVANGFWHYLPTAGDYLPLQRLDPDSWVGGLLTPLLGPDFASLALSSITGPCYFAVTLDAIALGKWFDCQNE